MRQLDRTRTAPGDARTFALVVLLLLFAAPGTSRAGYAVDLPDAMRDAAYVGSSACLDCHDTHPAEYYSGFHADIPDERLAGFSNLGCESCHGPASLHVDSEDPDLIVNPATADPALANGLCIQCHRSGALDGFRASLHGMNDLSCVSCHAVHGEEHRAMLRAPQTELCAECHRDTTMRMYLPSRHPLREGRMVCSDCHDPHSDEYVTATAGGRSVDLCFECHANKQGPFIFEHSPVIEDCMICHEPHGTVANSLLRQNEPFLCLQCHQTHFHATLEGYEGAFTTLDGYSGVSTHDSTKRTMLTKCTQCHSEVHGSDLPSQSISGMGSALTR
ncbi:DmsE family decaheme c-type cytochrome [bacterium]|nr:DmsE family decaheme c-type cytochrome [bacterium]